MSLTDLMKIRDLHNNRLSIRLLWKFVHSQRNKKESTLFEWNEKLFMAKWNPSKSIDPIPTCFSHKLFTVPVKYRSFHSF